MQSKYETVIGLEIHVQLGTASKLFCSCQTEFGAEPNSHCCPICLGLPGSLPVLNRKAVEYGIRAGLALHCTVLEYSKFDRKNYFYPDLPKGYQVSQLDLPICENGRVDFDLDTNRCSCGITRLHLEEEAGKSMHSGASIVGSDFSDIDYNRSGIPLIEIVTEPDLRSPAQAKAFLTQLKSILRYTDVSDCKMEEGSLRCDANISLRPVGSSVFGTRVEIKNLNSFKSVEKALIYEAKRQAKLYDDGAQIKQETRAWDEARQVTVGMRSKEESNDYRYFQEPDLVPLQIDPSWVRNISRSLPELPLAKKERLVNQYGLGPSEADILCSDYQLAAYFEEAVSFYSDGKMIANWLLGEFMRLVNSSQIDIPQLKVKPENLAKLIELVANRTISNTQAKKVFEQMFVSGKEPARIVEEEGLQQISDVNKLEQVISDVLAANPEAVAKYRAGKVQLIGFFVGRVIRETQGKANPSLVSELLKRQLES